MPLNKKREGVKCPLLLSVVTGFFFYYFVFFFVVMVVVLGGMFTFLSFSLCGGLTMAGMGWLYFLLMGMIAIVLGAFGSVFNTYSGLYLAKDNDLLLLITAGAGLTWGGMLLRWQKT